MSGRRTRRNCCSSLPRTRTASQRKREKSESEKEKPKPIVIDRYHFKQDIEGYLSTNTRPELIYLYDIATGKLDKLTTDTKFTERERGLVAGWYANRIHQQS
jgi:hypothetical protein